MMVANLSRDTVLAQKAISSTTRRGKGHQPNKRKGASRPPRRLRRITQVKTGAEAMREKILGGDVKSSAQAPLARAGYR